MRRYGLSTSTALNRDGLSGFNQLVCKPNDITFLGKPKVSAKVLQLNRMFHI